MPRIEKNIVYMGIGIAIISIILLTIGNDGVIEGDWDLITSGYLSVLPYLLFTGVSIVYIFRSGEMKMINNVLIGAFIGIGFAGLIGYYYDNDIWFDTVITGDNTLWEVQLLIITVWIIIGIIKGSVQNSGGYYA